MIEWVFYALAALVLLGVALGLAVAASDLEAGDE